MDGVELHSYGRPPSVGIPVGERVAPVAAEDEEMGSFGGGRVSDDRRHGSTSEAGLGIESNSSSKACEADRFRGASAPYDDSDGADVPEGDGVPLVEPIPRDPTPVPMAYFRVPLIGFFVSVAVTVLNAAMLVTSTDGLVWDSPGEGALENHCGYTFFSVIAGYFLMSFVVAAVTGVLVSWMSRCVPCWRCKFPLGVPNPTFWLDPERRLYTLGMFAGLNLVTGSVALVAMSLRATVMVQSMLRAARNGTTADCTSQFVLSLAPFLTVVAFAVVSGLRLKSRFKEPSTAGHPVLLANPAMAVDPDAEDEAEEVYERLRMMDSSYKWRACYAQPRDPRVCVRKRYRFGWTINWSHRHAIPTCLGLTLLSIVLGVIFTATGITVRYGFVWVK